MANASPTKPLDRSDLTSLVGEARKIEKSPFYYYFYFFFGSEKETLECVWKMITLGKKVKIPKFRFEIITNSKGEKVSSCFAFFPFIEYIFRRT